MVDQAAPAAAAQKEPARVSAAMRYYMLIVLTLVTSVGIMDRQIMGILAVPIRDDLHLTDGEIGSLGLAFTLVYVFACFPVARLADRWSRVNVIAIGVSVWSALTAMCGFAQNTVQLLIARAAVAIGEAGGAPPSHGLIGDIFPRHERATAMSILMVCSSLGLAGGLFIGGTISAQHGWRAAFWVAGALGFLLGPLVYFTFPRIRQGAADGAKGAIKQPPFIKTMLQLLSIRALLFLILAAAMQAFITVGLQTWSPSFLARSHGMAVQDIGAVLAGVFGFGSLIGHVAGGPVLDLLGKRDLRWHFWAGALFAAIAGIFTIMALYAPLQLAFYFLAAQIFFNGLMSGPVIAIIMNLAPLYARATASALFTLIINLLGVGLGPKVIGDISDALRPVHGEESLRWALIYTTAVMIPAAIFYLIGSVFYRKDLATAEARNEASVTA